MAGREGDSFISPQVQRDQITRWADFREVAIVDWHTELDVSGGKARRQGLELALERVEAGTVDGLVVAKIDRFARSLTAALDAIKRIDDAGGTFVSVAEGIDPSTPTGKAMQNLMLVFAEFELDRVRENWREARRRAVERGVHVSSRTPTGYERGADGILIPGASAPKIAEIFNARSAGASWSELAKIMDGVPSPYGSTIWTNRALSHLVKNRAYLGEARSGDFHLADAHEPLVEAEIWQAAQRPAGAPSPAKGTTLLSGLLRCAGCRYCMKPTKMKTRRGERVRMYHCRGRRSAGVCERRSAVLGSVVEPWVVERFFAQIDSLGAMRENSSSGIAKAQKRRDGAERELVAYRDESLIDVIGSEAYLDGLRIRAAALDEAEAALARARDDAGLAEIPDVATLRETWPDLTIPEQRQLLSAAIDCIFLRSVDQANVPVSDRALILWRGEAPSSLPGPGRRIGELTPYEWTP